MNMNFLNKTESLKWVRTAASQACLLTFQRLLNKRDKISEIKFSNLWQELMLKTGKIQGFWYQPPPGGTAVLYFNDKNTSRSNYASLREKKYWPKSNSFFHQNGGGYLFTSPFYISENFPIIGDFGFSFYTGENEEIMNHFQSCLNLISSMIRIIKPKMKFKELYKTSISLMEKNGYSNFIESSTDESGTNIGHTIPFLDNDPTPDELEIIQSGNEEKISN